MAKEEATAVVTIQHDGRYYQGRGTGENPESALKAAIGDIHTTLPNAWRRDLLADGEDSSHLSDVRRARHSPNPDDRYV